MLTNSTQRYLRLILLCKSGETTPSIANQSHWRDSRYILISVPLEEKKEERIRGDRTVAVAAAAAVATVAATAAAAAASKAETRIRNE